MPHVPVGLSAGRACGCCDCCCGCTDEQTGELIVSADHPVYNVREADGTECSVSPAKIADEQAATGGEITLFVCKAFTGQIVRARVSLYDSVEQALPVIADQIEYSSPDWEKIGLYNLTGDFEYDMNGRFIDQGTGDGDLVIMADGGACHKE